MFKYNYLWLVMLSLLCNAGGAKDRKVLLIQFDECETDDQFFAGGPGNYWYQLQQACAEHGYHLTTKRDDPQDVFAVIAFNAPHQNILDSYPCAKKILYTWEPPAIQPPYNYTQETCDKFDIVMTWHDGLIDGRKYRKYNYALYFEVPQKIVPFNQKRLCVMLAGNKRSNHPGELYSKRLQLIRFFEGHAPHDFDLYGTGWSSAQRKSYRGWVEDKIRYMRYYKFAIAYENSTGVPGYISEKIFDAFSAGCVPVYWGASNVTVHIPKNCFIDRRRFTNDAALYEFLKNMPEEQYNEYLTNIRVFLQSEEAGRFSRNQFIQGMIEVLRSCEPCNS